MLITDRRGPSKSPISRIVGFGRCEVGVLAENDRVAFIVMDPDVGDASDKRLESSNDLLFVGDTRGLVSTKGLSVANDAWTLRCS